MSVLCRRHVPAPPGAGGEPLRHLAQVCLEPARCVTPRGQTQVQVSSFNQFVLYLIHLPIY